ncbi:hypothetical protein T05_212, partial [Trichinella murrelli]
MSSGKQSRKPANWNSLEMDTAWFNFVRRNFFAIIVRYSFIFNTLVQYFVVLGNLIFHHFRSISNKLKTVVSLRFAMCIKSSIY